VLEALKVRLIDIPNSLAWSLPLEASRKNRARLLAMKDRHRGERCFIMGNGPSLAKMDLAPLQGEVTFGLNRVYLLFDKLPFRPTYYVCVNDLVLAQFAEEIRSLSMPKFLSWTARKDFPADDPGTLFIKLAYSFVDRFARDFDGSFYAGGTVTYVALQIAYLMGFSEVVLIGVDHSFVDQGIPSSTEIRKTDIDVNHFHPQYFPKGTKWQLPDLVRSEMAYRVARDTFIHDGRIVKDATVNGHCPIFEKADFKSLF
jgi:hypothetical protein